MLDQLHVRGSAGEKNVVARRRLRGPAKNEGLHACDVDYEGYVPFCCQQIPDNRSIARPCVIVFLPVNHPSHPFMNYCKLASHAATTTTATLRKSLVCYRFLDQSPPQRSLATTTTTTSPSITSVPAHPSSSRQNISPCRYTTLPLRGQHQIRRSSTTPQSSQANMLLNTNSKKHKVTVIGSGNW